MSHLGMKDDLLSFTLFYIVRNRTTDVTRGGKGYDEQTS